MAIAAFEDALAAAGVTGALRAGVDRRALAEDGYVILRRAICADDLPALRETFEANVLAPHEWPMPREHGTRHAMLDDDAAVRRICLLPEILATVHAMLGQRFYLKNVQGRDPKHNGGYQGLHRDWPDEGGEHRMAVGLAFLDPYGPDNGATRLVPGTQDDRGDMSDHAEFGERHPRQIVVEGEAGDVLLFQGRLVHSGLRNVSGAPRRTLQICYEALSTRDMHRECRRLDGLPELDLYLMGATP